MHARLNIRATETPRRVAAYGALGGVRADRVLQALNLAVRTPARWLAGAFPDAFNPILQAGLIANTTFVVAVVSGILLLLWYVPSVHHAFDSVEAMAEAKWTAELMRSLHRYSSDACMFFAALHGLQSLAGRRFGGPRWLAWTTGIAMVFLLWFLGWTGYWLVWDQRGQQVAFGTAKLLDVLPVFVDPLGRSFLTNESISSLLFFLVFFLHMLLPLAMGVGIWLHVMRLSRTPYFTNRGMTAWILVTLVALCLLLPATSAPRADMQTIPGRFTLDAWYLVPVAFADRLASGSLWAILLGCGAALFSVPWSLTRSRPAAATVVEARCNACGVCFEDCPYGAIRMAPRRDGRSDRPAVAVVDPDLCLSCGVCNGSCSSAGIGVPWWSEIEQRKRLDRFLGEAARAGEPVRMAFVCAESAAGRLGVDLESGRAAELPGYRVLPMPCAGWLLAYDVERAVRRGAAGVLVASCSPGLCSYREGAQWAAQRLAGERLPALRPGRFDEDRFRMVQLDRGQYGRFLAEAERLGAERDRGRVEARLRRSWIRWAVALPTAALFAGLVYLPSDLAYSGPPSRDPALIVSFKHPGRAERHCRQLAPEELEKLPVHMRRQEVCERRRAPVRMRLRVDGEEVFEQAYPPRGLFGDGSSIAIERLALAPGEHDIEVRIGDSLDPDSWPYRAARRLRLEPGRIRVMLFDRSAGFTWY